jgi:hypothetical protein
MDIINQLSPEMRAYFISQTDPFHDNPYRIEGAPSSINSKSVVLTYNTESTISAATFGLPVTEGSKFDVHFCSMPLVGVVQTQGCNVFYPGVIRNSGSNFSSVFEFGCVTAYGVPNGTPTFTTTSSTATTLQKAFPGELPNFLSEVNGTSASSRVFRLIGLSYEVIDQSPKLYQQGTVTCYESPCSTRIDGCYMNPIYSSTATTSYGHRAVADLRSPPFLLEQASAVPGAQTWSSSRGAYIVARKNVEEVPYLQLSPLPLVFYGDPSSTDPGPSCENRSYVSRNITNTGLVNVTSQFCSPVPYNMYGAYFQGLSSQYCSLRLRIRQIFEVLANPTDQDYLPLMTPTVPRDPIAEKLIDDVLSNMSPFVPQDMNPKGEAWRKVLMTTSKLLKSGSLFAEALVPGTGALAISAGEAFELGANLIKKKPKKNKVSLNVKATPKGQKPAKIVTTATV